MLKTNLSLIVVAAVCVFCVQQSAAGPLTSAEVTKIINRVSVIDPAKGGHPATIRDVIKDDLGLQTGAKSRSELLFQDNTLTRLGAETFFSFKTGTRDMTLEKGSMLLQVPKGLGGAKIHTAAVTAAITGTTIMMEYMPKQYIKVLVLEGSLRLSRNGAFGDSLLLHAGKMVIMRPDAKNIPDPIDVNLEHIVNTSTLVKFTGGTPLPSMALIQAAIDEQKRQLAKGQLVPTNLVMGAGTNVIFVSTNQIANTVGLIGPSGVNSSGARCGFDNRDSRASIGRNGHSKHSNEHHYYHKQSSRLGRGCRSSRERRVRRDFLGNWRASYSRIAHSKHSDEYHYCHKQSSRLGRGCRSSRERRIRRDFLGNWRASYSRIAHSKHSDEYDYCHKQSSRFGRNCQPSR